MRTKLIGVKEFRQNIASLYAKAVKNGWSYIVMNHQKPLFEVRPLTHKEVVLEQLVKDVAAAREDVKKGKVYTAAEVRRKLGL